MKTETYVSKISKAFAAISLVIMSGSALASPNQTTTVNYVGTYGSGRFFVGTHDVINEPGCAKARFDVPGSHAERSHWLMLAKTAAEKGYEVRVKTNGCYAGYPTMDGTTNSWFFMWDQ